MFKKYKYLHSHYGAFEIWPFLGTLTSGNSNPFLCVIHGLCNASCVFQAWSKLFSLAETKIEIVSYHWGLQKGSKRGKRVFDALLNALDRNVSLNIVHTANKIKDDDGTDIQDLQGDSTSLRWDEIRIFVKRNRIKPFQ